MSQYEQTRTRNHNQPHREDKPYVNKIGSQPEKIFIALEWAEYLATVHSLHTINQCLQYYQSLNWISNTVIHEMNKYIHCYKTNTQADADSSHLSDLYITDNTDDQLIMTHTFSLDIIQELAET